MVLHLCLLHILAYWLRSVNMVKLINKTQVCLTKGGIKGEIFPRSSFSHNFPCVLQQQSLLWESCTSVSLLIWALREGMFYPLALFPAELIPCTVFNWVICLLICFIAHEGDSVELRDREYYSCGKERRLLLPSQCFYGQGEGRPVTGRSAPNASLPFLFQTLQLAGPKIFSFS